MTNHMMAAIMQAARNRVSLDSDALDWQTRVLANGGTVSSLTMAAMSDFCVAMKAASVWTKINRINMFAGDQLAACLVPLKIGGGSSVEGNTGFLAAHYAESTGLQGAVTRELDTGLLDSTLGATGGVGYYLLEPYNLGGAVGVGTGPSTNRFWGLDFLNNAARSFYGGTGIAQWFIGSPPPAALYAAWRGSPTVHRVTRNGIAVGSNTVSHTVLNVGTSFKVNSLGGARYMEKRAGGYWIDDGTLTDADQLTIYNIWQTFQTALGRAV